MTRKTIDLPKQLSDAIEKYLDTNWSSTVDPSKFGALNAVAYIGECVVALYATTRITATTKP
jgi:hypothetical protein